MSDLLKLTKALMTLWFCASVVSLFVGDGNLPVISVVFHKLAGGLKHFIIFTPKIWEDEPILTNIFQMGWFNHQPDFTKHEIRIPFKQPVFRGK